MTTTENTAIDSAVVVAEAGDPAQPSSPEAAAVTPAAEDSAEDSADDPTKKENLRELREKAMAQYDSMAEDPKRLQRLNFLLEKSTAYVSFVAAKLESNRQDKKKTNKRKAPVSDAKQDTKTKKSKKKRGKRLEIAATADNGDAGSKKGDEEEEAEEEEEQRTISGEVVSERQPKLITGGIMREYQLEGMEWMASLYENGLNGILADEMGLGKTLQTIAFLCYLRERRVYGPFLVLCPLSTLRNWISEFVRFAPETPVLMYHGTPDERRKLRKDKLHRLDTSFPVVVTTYEMAMRDRLALQRFAWKYIIIDEGHRIKNMNCKLIRDLKMYQSANRLLLTGTPLQNSLAELWALLNFLLPEIFDDLDSFQAWFDFNDINEREGRDRIISEETQNSVVSKLHHILQPFLLRRLKSDVEKFLPPKREYLIACPMAPVQYEYYQAVRGPNLREFLQTRLASDQETTASVTPAESATATTEDDVDEEEEKGEKGEKREEEEAPPMRMRTRLTHQAEAVIDEDDDSLTLVPSGSSTPSQQKQQQQQRDVGLEQLRTKTMIKQMNLQFRLMQLRKVCQHPYLFDFPVTDPTDPESPYLIDEQLVRTSGKLIVLDRLLPELFKNGHRVLIFSQFSRVLDILDFYATMRNWRFCRIDGAVQQGDREQQIAEFNTNTDIPLFFLTTRSGGLGINLTAADTVVIFDSDWNPQQDLQAQDRVHRIGQTRPVIIYRLVVAGSCEGAILKRANSKRKLEKLVIHERKFKGLGRNNATGNTTRDETGAAAGTDKSKDELSVQDIAQILMADDTELVEKDQRELKDTLERLGPDDPVPGEAVLTQEELAALTDRSPAAYKPKAVVPSVLHQASRIEELVATRDETNDMLAKMEKL